MLTCTKIFLNPKIRKDNIFEWNIKCIPKWMLIMYVVHKPDWTGLPAACQPACVPEHLPDMPVISAKHDLSKQLSLSISICMLLSRFRIVYFLQLRYFGIRKGNIYINFLIFLSLVWVINKRNATNSYFPFLSFQCWLAVDMIFSLSFLTKSWTFGSLNNYVLLHKTYRISNFFYDDWENTNVILKLHIYIYNFFEWW